MKRFIRVYGSGSGSVRHPGYEACAKVRLIVDFEILKTTYFSREKQSTAMFNCLFKGTILFVRQ